MIKKQFFITVLFFCMSVATSICHDVCTGSLEGSLEGCLENGFDRFSLILFTLEKNVVRVERYSLDELAHDVNRLSKKESNSHCRYILHLGERGQQVTNIGWNFSNMKNLMIETMHGKKQIYYALDWAALLAKENEKAQGFMRADVTIREVFNVALKQPRDAQKKGITWLSSLAITWGICSHQLAINLIIEGKVHAACAAIVPNYFLDDTGDACVDLKKSDLIDADLLTKIIHRI